MIHATEANGEGSGRKNARDKDLQCDMKGLRLSLRWLKTTRSKQQRSPSSTGYTPREGHGDVTLPLGQEWGGGPPAM
jgi:hypothetical protein